MGINIIAYKLLNKTIDPTDLKGNTGQPKGLISIHLGVSVIKISFLIQI
jgi:hypothetical protein